MGDVIMWAERRKAVAPRPRETGEPVGRVLFFTGVRYERTADPFAPNSEPEGGEKQGGSRRRKRRG